MLSKIVFQGFDVTALFYLRTPEKTAFNGMLGANESTIVLCNEKMGCPISGWPGSLCQTKGSITASLQKRLLAKSCYCGRIDYLAMNKNQR